MTLVFLDYSQIFDYKYSVKMDGIERVEFYTKEAIGVGYEVKIRYPGAQLKYWTPSGWETTDVIFYGVVVSVNVRQSVRKVIAYGIMYKLVEHYLHDTYTYLGTGWTYGRMIKDLVKKVFGTDDNVFVVGTDVASGVDNSELSLDGSVFDNIKMLAKAGGARLIFFQDKLYVVYPDGESSLQLSGFDVMYSTVANLRIGQTSLGNLNLVIVEGMRDVYNGKKSVVVDTLSGTDVDFIFPTGSDFSLDTLAPDTVTAVYVDNRPIPLSRVTKVNNRYYKVDISGYTQSYYSDYSYFNDITVTSDSEPTGSNVVVYLPLNSSNINWDAIHTDSNGIPQDVRFVLINDSGVIELPFYYVGGDISNGSMYVYVKLPSFNGNVTIRMYYGNPNVSFTNSLSNVINDIVFDYNDSVTFDYIVEDSANSIGQYTVSYQDGNPIQIDVTVDCNNDSGESRGVVRFDNGKYYNVLVIDGEITNGDFTGSDVNQYSAIVVYDGSSWYEAISNYVENTTVSDSNAVVQLSAISSAVVGAKFSGFCGTNYTGGGSATAKIYRVWGGLVNTSTNVSVSQAYDNNVHTVEMYYSAGFNYVGFAYELNGVTSDNFKSAKYRIGWVNSFSMANSIAQSILDLSKSSAYNVTFSVPIGYWFKIIGGVIGFLMHLYEHGEDVWLPIKEIQIQNGLVNVNIGSRYMSLDKYVQQLREMFSLSFTKNPRNFPNIVPDFSNGTVYYGWS